MSGLYSGSGSIDATSYGLNPGVTTDAFTQTLSTVDQGQEKRDEAQRLFSRWGIMDTEAVNWKLHWQRAYEFIVPRKEDVIAMRMPGDDRESDIYDTTAVLANEQLAAALHSMLTNPELRFFELLFGDPNVDALPEVKQWCEESADSMYQVLNSSNFQTEIHETYIDLPAAGTACLYMEEDDDYIVRFSTRALKEVRLDENAFGRVDTVARMFKLRPQQILEMFPDLLNLKGVQGDLQMAADKNPIDSIQILHMVEPVRNSRDTEHVKKISAKGHKFSSTYMLYDKKFIIHQGSYEEFPYCTPRWSKTTGEKYGRGPGFQMLPDVMMVNAMMYTIIQSAQLAAAPPMGVEDDSVIGQVRLTPLGVTIVRAGAQFPKQLIEGLDVKIDQAILEDVRKRIRAGFHLDQLVFPQETPQKTAEEVREIAQQNMRFMGPVLGRQHFELLDPMVRRLFGIMNRKGKFKPLPAVVRGRKFQVRYSSLLARVQRLQEVQNIQRAVATLQPIVQVKPSIMDNIKWDDFTKKVLRDCGVPEKLIPSDQELRRVRAQQQKDAADMKAKMDQMHQSEIAKNTAPLVQSMGNAQQGQGQPLGSQSPGV